MRHFETGILEVGLQCLYSAISQVCQTAIKIVVITIGVQYSFQSEQSVYIYGTLFPFLVIQFEPLELSIQYFISYGIGKDNAKSARLLASKIILQQILVSALNFILIVSVLPRVAYLVNPES